MYSVFLKEIHSFFSSIIGYMVVAIFLVMNGLFMWVFADTSILEYNYASMDQLFSIAPLIFLFLIPAITMRSFAEERQRGTIEFLYTKPIGDNAILLGKFLANFVLVLFALLPTLIYYYSVYQLGAPKGNLDTGAIIGSYIGLFFLAASFVAIGMFASSISENQIVAFIFGAFLCFIMHWSFTYIARMPVFVGNIDGLIAALGLNHHYVSMSKGAIDSRDLIYFLSIIILFLTLTQTSILSRK